MWPLIPAALVLGLFIYVVPYGFVQMYLIHSSLLSEVEMIDGFEARDRNIHWFPARTGGELVLDPQVGAGHDELREAIRVLGYDGSQFVGYSRPRTDEFDADTVNFVARDDGTFLAEVSVFDTDLVLSWPLLTLVAGALLLPAVGVGRAVQNQAVSKSGGPSEETG